MVFAFTRKTVVLFAGRALVVVEGLIPLKKSRTARRWAPGGISVVKLDIAIETKLIELIQKLAVQILLNVADGNNPFALLHGALHIELIVSD